MNTKTYKIDQTHNDLIENFCEKCNRLGFKNNNSLKAMKYDWCIDQGGAWFGTFKNNILISLSGIHPFRDGFRALFRGAQLEHNPIAGLNRYQLQSYPIYAQLPLQIEYADNLPVYITTNIEHDASGRMNRIHKSFKIMEQNGLVTHEDDEYLFYTWQSVWKLNILKYQKIREKYND